MLVFNCTKSATDYLSVKRKGEIYTSVISPRVKTIAESLTQTSKNKKCWDWVLHAFKVKRKSLMIAMDYHSRFAMIVNGISKGDEGAFIDIFCSHLAAHVMLLMQEILGSSESDVDESLGQFVSENQDVTFYQRGDRSVQTHINDAVYHIFLENWINQYTDMKKSHFSVLLNKHLNKANPLVSNVFTLNDVSKLK